MKLKCTNCNGCLNMTWIGTRRLFLCDFCNKLFDSDMNGLREVDKVLVEKDINGNDSIKQIIYKYN